MTSDGKYSPEGMLAMASEMFKNDPKMLEDEKRMIEFCKTKLDDETAPTEEEMAEKIVKCFKDFHQSMQDESSTKKM